MHMGIPHIFTETDGVYRDGRVYILLPQKRVFVQDTQTVGKCFKDQVKARIV